MFVFILKRGYPRFSIVKSYSSLSIIKHSACELVHEVNVLQGFDNSRHMKLFKHLLFSHYHFLL